MARDYASVNLAIWADHDFLNLPPEAQHLYLLLWTSPTLTFCGTDDWRPGRLTQRAAGFTVERITTAADCLRARHFLVVDELTEEVLLRSWIRFDGVLTNPRTAISFTKAFARLASADVKSALVHELKKVRAADPDRSWWADERLVKILEWPSASAKDQPTPADPFTHRVAPGSTPDATPSATPGLQANARGSATPSANPSPTPAPTPTPLHPRTSAIQEGANPTPEPEDAKASTGEQKEDIRPDVEDICAHMLASALERGAKRASITKAWRTAARLMVDKDGYTVAQVKWLIDKSAADSFWASNILSMPTLREKADQLKIKFRGADDTPRAVKGEDPNAWMRRRP